MRGQWLGGYEGSSGPGRLMINVDRVEEHFEGAAYLLPIDKTLPGTVAYLDTEGLGDEHFAKAYTAPIDPRTGLQTTWDKIKDLYPPGTTFSKEAAVHLAVAGHQLTIEGCTDTGITFSAEVRRPDDKAESKIAPRAMSWAEFKAYASSVSKSRYLYRGQQKPWRLCTSFHRRGRYRIGEFTSKDVRQLHQRLSAITPHYFDLSNPDQNGAFFNLLQHHGYPTPLLDWSHSPYVAAFFAFRDTPIGYSGDEVVRIYVFNNQEWQKRFPQIQNLDPPFPHLSVMEFSAIANPRLIPQQAVISATNVYDIEAYLQERANEIGVPLLEAIDIPAKEREVAMTDLRFMGITAGSMFPGIDGLCEDMKERNFDQ